MTDQTSMYLCTAHGGFIIQKYMRAFSKLLYVLMQSLSLLYKLYCGSKSV